MNKKIGYFISSIVTFLFSTILIYFLYRNFNILPDDGFEALVFIAKLPVGIISLVILVGSFLSTVITSIKASFSSMVFIRIISILILLLSLLEVGYVTYNIFSNLSIM